MSAPSAAKAPPVLGTFRRGEPGTVLQLKLHSGQIGYVQYICPGWFAPAIRVLPGAYGEPLGEAALRTFVAGASLFRTQYGIDREWRRAGARIIARLPIPKADTGMPPFRMSAHPADEQNCWVMRPDGTTACNPEYAAENPDVDFDGLPLWDIPFFGTLSWMMETQWTPRLARGMSLHLPDRPEPPDREPAAHTPTKKRRLHTTYLAILPSEQATIAAHEELQGVNVKSLFGYDEDNEEWFLRVERPGRPDDEIEAQLRSVAQRYGGYLEGHIVGPFS